MIIESRLGKRDVDENKIISFPRGIIGFEELRQFALLRINENSPLLILQSIENALMGLLVADPFYFVQGYNPQLTEVGKSLLKKEDFSSLAVLVSATIPQGKPEETALNLLGPFFINEELKVGVQVPQIENSFPSRALIYQQSVSL